MGSMVGIRLMVIAEGLKKVDSKLHPSRAKDVPKIRSLFRGDAVAHESKEGCYKPFVLNDERWSLCSQSRETTRYHVIGRWIKFRRPSHHFVPVSL